MPIDVRSTNASSEKIYVSFKYDENKTFEDQVNEIKEVYNMAGMSRSMMSDIVGENVSHQNRFVRSSADRQAARELSERMRTKMANFVVGVKAATHSVVEAVPNAKLNRGTIYFRTEQNDPEASKFNLSIGAASVDNPKEVGRLKYEELERVREKLGLKNFPDDIINLYNISDRELVDKFEDIYRYCYLVTELANGDATAQLEMLSPEMIEHVKAQSEAIGLITNINTRCDIIANHLYEEYDPYKLFAMKINPESIKESMDEWDFESGRISNNMHPMHTYFDKISALYTTGLTTVIPRAEAAQPDLKGALLSVDEKNLPESIDSGVPVIATAKSGKQYVLTASMAMDKVPTVEEYAQKLSARAMKADRFLLTGSKEFAKMQKELKLFNEARENPETTREQLELRTAELEKAARDYLKYKKVDVDKYDGYSKLRGKNMREQSRLEVAGDILGMAKAQKAMIAAQKEAEIPEEVRREAKRKAEEAEKKKLEENLKRAEASYKNKSISSMDTVDFKQYLRATMKEKPDEILAGALKQGADIKTFNAAAGKMMETVIARGVIQQMTQIPNYALGQKFINEQKAGYEALKKSMYEFAEKHVDKDMVAEIQKVGLENASEELKAKLQQHKEYLTGKGVEDFFAEQKAAAQQENAQVQQVKQPEAQKQQEVEKAQPEAMKMGGM